MNLEDKVLAEIKKRKGGWITANAIAARVGISRPQVLYYVKTHQTAGTVKSERGKGFRVTGISGPISGKGPLPATLEKPYDEHTLSVSGSGMFGSIKREQASTTVAQKSRPTVETPPLSTKHAESTEALRVEREFAMFAREEDAAKLEELIVRKGLPYHIGSALVALFDNDVTTAKSYLEMAR